MKLRRWDDVTAFSLNRLDDDARDFVRRHRSLEEFVFELVERVEITVGDWRALRAIAVRIVDVANLSNQRREACPLCDLAGG